MTTKAKILDIAMNLNRIGNWAADGYHPRQKKIRLFLKQTSGYLKTLRIDKLPLYWQKTMLKFLKEYKQLEKAGMNGPKAELVWAEKMMTWGNILTHRSILLN